MLQTAPTVDGVGPVEAGVVGMKRPRVLVIADAPGWAWDRKAQAYRSYLGGAFDIAVRYYQSLAEADCSSADLIHTFEVRSLDFLPAGVSAPVISGLTAHVSRTWGPDRMAAWASRCWGLHGNSPALCAELRPYHSRIYYTPNGVDLDYWRRLRPRKSDRFTVCYVGKPNARKGWPVIQEVCRELGIPLLSCIRTAQVALPPEDVRELYQDAWVQVTLSDKDGTPNPHLESAACENALIGPAIGNLPEIIRPAQTGILLSSWSREELWDALSGFMRSPDAVEFMGRRAREVLIEDRWDWSFRVQAVARMWRGALGLSP